ncbi:MAG: PspC domain-containing protein [Lachnospiraceae bacterium]|nr:PspC domain-containing protein [Lachnospiraceae bacterium]
MKDIKLHRSVSNKLLAGVCGGLGESFGIDPSIVRLIWVLVSLVLPFGAGLVLYIVAAVILPKEEI